MSIDNGFAPKFTYGMESRVFTKKHYQQALANILTNTLSETAAQQIIEKNKDSFPFAETLFAGPYPRLFFFSTKITSTLNAEKLFLKKWVEFAFNKLKDEDEQVLEQLKSPQASAPLMLGLFILVQSNLNLLNDLTNYRTNDNWALANPRIGVFKQPPKRFMNIAGWGKTFDLVCGLIRRNHQENVANLDTTLAKKLLEHDGTWLTTEAFRPFVQDLWQINIERSLAGMDVPDKEEAKKEKQKMTSALQHWFAIRYPRDREERDSLFRAFHNHHIALALADEEYDLYELANLLEDNASVFNIPFGSGRTGTIGTLDRYSRFLRKGKLPGLVPYDHAIPRLKPFMDHPLGEAFHETAPFQFRAYIRRS